MKGMRCDIERRRKKKVEKNISQKWGQEKKINKTMGKSLNSLFIPRQIYTHDTD